MPGSACIGSDISAKDTQTVALFCLMVTANVAPKPHASGYHGPS